jgi:hypothetical protein
VDHTFDMATGVGDNSPDRMPYDIDANETGPNRRAFYLGVATQEKLDAAFAAGDYSWGPNEVVRYTSSQTFVLSAAMDALLKTKEGPDADLWEHLSEEVFQPIGIHHMTMMHVPNGGGESGTPLMASGLRLTIDDVGKITTLLQNEERTTVSNPSTRPERTTHSIDRVSSPDCRPASRSATATRRITHLSGASPTTPKRVPTSRSRSCPAPAEARSSSLRMVFQPSCSRTRARTPTA